MLTFLLASISLLQVAFVLTPEFIKESYNEEERVVIEFPLRTQSVKLTHGSNLKKVVKETFTFWRDRIDDVSFQGSGFTLLGFLSLGVQIGECRDIFGGSAACKSIVINQKKDLLKNLPRHSDLNTSGDCFLRCIVYSFLGSQMYETLYEAFRNDHIVMKVPIPVPLKDIPKFEKDNRLLNLKVNVFMLDCPKKGSISLFPLYLSKFPKRKNEINLLLSEYSDFQDCTPHYFLIKNISMFVRKTYVRENGVGRFKKRASVSRVSICLNCLTRFSTKKTFQNHEKYCKMHKPHILLPCEKYPVIQFENYKNKFPVAVTCYYDFEARNMTDKNGCTTQRPFSFCLIFLNQQKKLMKEVTYVGYDCVEKFFETLKSMEIEIEEYLKTYYPLDWDSVSEAEKKYCMSPQAKCHNCEKTFSAGELRHRDHFHLQEKNNFAGISCVPCNRSRRVKKRIPVLAHNASGYDLKFFGEKLDIAKDIF